jgi:outer membrane protein OmpA-like peptidoglycan-associated protein
MALFVIRRMKITPLLILLFIAIVLPCFSQEHMKRKKPLMVSHLPEVNRAMLQRKDAPRHTIFSKVICFKSKCRAYIGWRTGQRSMRFRGYKDGGKMPRRTTTPKLQQPVLKDTVIIAERPVLPDTVRAVAPATISTRLFILDDVLFEVNSATLNPTFTCKLDSLTTLLTDHPELTATISGHTDNTGIESRNRTLSLARASAVSAYLQKNNIDRRRITVEGLGSVKPIESNATAAGRKRNRRVEILLKDR